MNNNEQLNSKSEGEEKSFEDLENLSNINKCSDVMKYLEDIPVFEERKELFEKLYNSNEKFKKFWDDAKGDATHGGVVNSTLLEEMKEKFGEENI